MNEHDTFRKEKKILISEKKSDQRSARKQATSATKHENTAEKRTKTKTESLPINTGARLRRGGPLRAARAPHNRRRHIGATAIP